jgi:hypothetical protein
MCTSRRSIRRWVELWFPPDFVRMRRFFVLMLRKTKSFAPPPQHAKIARAGDPGFAQDDNHYSYRLLSAIAGYGRSGFLVSLAAAFGFALVPVLFALGDGQFALDAAVAEIKAGGDERKSLLLRLCE